MTEILLTGAKIATPLGCLGFIAALVYLLRTRQLKLKEIALEKLSPGQSARFLDENLSRYKIDASNATREEKFHLIKDEMEKRYRLAILYLLVSAFVFLVCFVLVALPFVSASRANPIAPAKASYLIIDSLTKDPIYRPLRVTYTLGRAAKTDHQNLTQHEQGVLELQGERAQIKIINVECPGYSFSLKNTKRNQDVIELDRLQDGPESFFDAIVPNEDDVDLVSVETYRDAVKGQKPPKTGEIELKCVNRSQYQVTLVLYRQSEKPQQFGHRPWTLLVPPCPGESEMEYSFHETGQDAYYYIFASVLGLEAVQLVDGNLHEPSAITLTLSPGDSPSKLIPRLYLE